MKTKLSLAFAFISIVSFQTYAMEKEMGKKDVPEAKFYVVKNGWHKQKPTSKFRRWKYNTVVIKAVKIQSEGTWDWQVRLKVLEPKNFIEQYGSSVLKKHFVKTEGPPQRTLS